MTLLWERQHNNDDNDTLSQPIGFVIVEPELQAQPLNPQELETLDVEPRTLELVSVDPQELETLDVEPRTLEAEEHADELGTVPQHDGGRLDRARRWVRAVGSRARALLLSVRNWFAR